jgi:hypothetical protein
VAAFIFVAAVLIALAHFVDFLLGYRGQRKLKDKLVAFYIAAAEEDWTSLLLKTPASLFHKYMMFLFGAPFSLRFFWRIFIYSFSFYFLVNITFDIVYPKGSMIYGFLYYRDVFWTDVLERSAILITNYVCDVGSFGTMMLFVGMIATSSQTRLFLLSILAGVSVSASAYIGVVLGDFFGGLGLSYMTTEDFDHFMQVVARDLAFKYRFYGLLYMMTESFNPRSRLFLLSFQVLLPMVCFIFVILTIWLMIASRSITKPVTLLIVERLEGATAGVCTTLASVASAIIGIVIALGKWWQ